jgi:myo-inositol-1(or 4)-monophosphatase
MFAARLGGGATLDGTPIRCSGETELSLALVATGFSYVPARRAMQAAAIARLIGEIRDIRRSGSAAIDLCWAAAGRVDAYFEEHLNSWDAAAGELVAREAGCITSDFGGGPADPSNIVAAGPGIHPALLDLIRRALE